jgi:hypothetical protein
MKPRINLRPLAGANGPHGFSTIRPDLIAYAVHHLNAQEEAYMSQIKPDDRVHNRIVLAGYHIMMANELALSRVLEVVEKIKLSPLYRFRIKSLTDKIEADANEYRDGINGFVTQGGGDEMEKLSNFASIHDNLDEAVESDIRTIRCAFTEALTHSGCSHPELLASSLTALKLCQAADAVAETQQKLSAGLAGGIMHHFRWVNVHKVTQESYELNRMLCKITRAAYPDESDDVHIEEVIAALCKKLGNMSVAAKALHDAVFDDAIPVEETKTTAAS